MNIDDFYNGNEWKAYEYFGAHPEKDGVRFCVYAPRAKKVSVIGEFNYWRDTFMDCEGRGGIYSIFIPEAKEGQMYKYRIYHHDGTVTDKADPYGFGMELRPCSASIIRRRDGYVFSDDEWMRDCDKRYDRPLNIFEMHFGSWKKTSEEMDGLHNIWYRYEEMGEVLIPYLKDNGYTHVEIMPLFEHPLDESWGYQSTGFFAPTSRYGTCDGLKSFINDCHNAGIGVILDFVMVHFATDDYGLKTFDGGDLYELPQSDITMSEWGSYNFFHAKGEVASFLKSCADYWLSDYHFDGLRFDAISNIIYWRGRQECGVNEKALEFVKSLNRGIKDRHPHAILFAEDSTTYLKVTAPVEYDGLGFDYKWDLGFMHDTLDFFACPVDERRNRYDQLLFSMHYFYNELYLLAFSHDEVVHGKKTLIDKMYGSYEDKFAQYRAFYLYWYTHPGKKLSFMGNEIAQFREWGEWREQDYDVLMQFPMHRMFARFSKDVGLTYLSHRALNEGEYNSACFNYIINDRRDDLVYAYERVAGGEKILAVFNFGGRDYRDYEIKIAGNHQLNELINSNAEIYGGSDKGNMINVPVRNNRCYVNLAAYSGRLFVVE
ncbi:MAG: 1,4-alpha-glucan branching protein GlgB [Lachnospiraceae bacterium]|nr:1,4-alpha-glucan branching protein GlgB [Lachnospiraceae bacterium]